MTSDKLASLLDKQVDAFTSIEKAHAKHIEEVLANHRFQIAQLMLHESPEPFVRVVFEHLRNGLRQTAQAEGGTVDAEDARCLLRILDRMELTALEGKPL